MSNSPQMDLLTTQANKPVLESPEAYRQLAQSWLDAGWIRELDLYFVDSLIELSNEAAFEACADMMFIALLLSHQSGRGHVCIDIKQMCDNPEQTIALVPLALNPGNPFYKLIPNARRLLTSFSEAYLVELVGQSTWVSSGRALTPIVFDGQRLYLRRLWLHESDIVKGISERLGVKAGLESASTPMACVLRESLARLFGESDPLDYQKAACALAARRQFSVITGGPGTGKTTTVVRLLAALQSMAEQDTQCMGKKYRIQLAAPTGKAAARLKVSIAAAVNELPLDQLGGAVSLEDIPTRVTTIHRLLGSKPNSRAFRQDASNPLMLDILVIDEASMVDIYLLAAVINALPAHAQLILIGDKDQLASVEAGAVLGELCLSARQGGYQDETLSWIKEIAAVAMPTEFADTSGIYLNQSVAMLRRSYRFAKNSGISQLAAAVNDNLDLQSLLNDAKASVFDDIEWVSDAKRVSDEPVKLTHLIQHSVNGFRPYLEYANRCRPDVNATRSDWDTYASELLRLYSKFQLLVAVRQGPWGVDNLNALVVRALHNKGLINKAEGWFSGRPIMVSRNDYNLDLWNGDLGLTLSVPWGEQGADVLRVAFSATNEQGEPCIRWVAPSRLPVHETVYAMTVHKSQGSEFEHCCLVLPDTLTQVISRELIYTAVTRARSKFSIYAKAQVLIEAAKSRVIRASGLRARLLLEKCH